MPYTRTYLLVEAVVGHQVRVLDAVVGGDLDALPPLPQLDDRAYAKVLRVHREGEAQIVLDVAVVPARRCATAEER